MLIYEPLHLLPNIFPRGISVRWPSGFRTDQAFVMHRSAYRFTHPVYALVWPMLSLSLNTPPEAQLEALRVLPDHRSGRFWLHASIALLDLFDSARFDHSGWLVCSHGPSQLPCCDGVGASPGAFSSAWPSVDPAYPNQTSETTRLTPIHFRSHPSWLSPTRLRSSLP